MRLLHITHDGKLTLEEFDTLHDEVPPYAVLSYISEDGDMAYSDLKDLDIEQRGIHVPKGTAWAKIRFCAKQVEHGGPNYFWIEACCVDHASISEVKEAFDNKLERLMNAQICYALLLDVFLTSLEGKEESILNSCTWFTHCWTFLDLFAPRVVEFFSRSGIRLGDRKSLLNIIREAARIPSNALLPDDLSFSNTTFLSNIGHVYDLCCYRLENCKRSTAYCRTGLFGCSGIKNSGKDQKRSLEQIRHARNNKERRGKIYRWLSAPDPSVDYQKALQQRLPGTVSWLLSSKEYKECRDRAGSSRLWIQGRLGSGKTILSSALIEDLRQHCYDDASMVTAYFYFGGVGRQDARSMLRAVLYQFLENLATIPDDIEVFFTDKQAELENPQQSTRALLELVRHVTSYFTQIYIVLDALDECVKDSEILVIALQEMMDWRSNKIHVLITSRKTQELERPLMRYFNLGEVVSLDDPQLNIEKLLCGRLAKWKDDDAFMQEIQVTLTYTTNRMTHEVESQLTRLSMCLTRAELRESLAALVQETDETYDRVLLSTNEDIAPYLQRILKWLACSFVPLTPYHMQEIIGLDPGPYPTFNSTTFGCNHVLHVLNTLGILVGISMPNWEEIKDSRTHTFLFEARSIREYLFSDRIKKGPAHRYSLQEEDECHKTIAEDCLKSLMQLQQSVPDISRSSLVVYAATTWDRHFRRTGEKEKDLVPLAMNLFSRENPAFLAWIRSFDPDSPFGKPDLERGLESIATPLYYAARLGLSSITTLLLDQGANVNAQGGRWGSPLQAAIARGHFDVYEILLDRGADVNAMGGEYGSALQIAASKGLVFAVKTLLDRGADINAWGGPCGTALQAAASKDQLNVVLMLLSKGAKIEVQRGKFENAIHAASVSGFHAVADFILEFTKATTGASIAPSDSGYASQKQVDSLPSPSIPDSAIQHSFLAGNQAIDQAPGPSDKETYPDDIRSIQSDNESIGSKISTTRSRAELFAVKHLAAFFAQLEDLRSLHETALQKIERTRFIPNYRRILKSYYCRLLNEAASETEKAVTRVLRSRRNRESIAEGIADQLELEEEPLMEKVLAQPTEKQYLEDWLRRIQETDDAQPISVNLAPILDGFQCDDNGSDSGFNTESEVDVQDEFTNIDGAETFL